MGHPSIPVTSESVETGVGNWQQCNGTCPEEYKACGERSCVQKSDAQKYFVCGTWCIYKSDWANSYYRSCGDTCLYR